MLLESNCDSHPRPALGRAVQEPRNRQGRSLRHRRSARRGQPGQCRRWSSATCATPSAPATCCARSRSPTCSQMMKKAGDLYAKAELPLGDGTQTPDQFVRMQSATTGLPEHMCRFNMEKNHFVLEQHGQDSRLADARPGSEHPLARLRRRSARRAGQLPGAVAGARAGAAVATRPACTRSGCRSFRCRSAWCSSPARRSRGRRTAWRQRVRPGGRAEAGDRDLSRPWRHRRRGAASSARAA